MPVKGYILIFIGLCFFLAPKAHAAISLAASGNTTETTGSTTQSVTINNQSSTDLNIVSVGFCVDVGCDTTPSATVSVYDSNGNTYTLATTTQTALGQGSIYYSANIASGNDTITASTSYGTSVYYLTVMASEWKGLATSNPLDQLGTSGGTSASPSVTSNGAIASAPELIYATIDNANVPTIVSPFTTIQTNGGDNDSYLVSSTLSTYTANWTKTSSAYFAEMATFKAATVTATSALGFAWGDRAGWVNFSSTYGNFQVNASTVTGYAWSQNFGWINLAPTSSGVTNNGLGNLSGYAWNTNFGWVNFSGVSISSSTGVFNGTATFAGTASGVYGGSIYFSCAECSVTTSWRPASSSAITIGTPVINGGSSTIILSPGTTASTTITVSSITDSNGLGTITYATSTFYRTASSSSCTANPLDCYQISSSSCVFSASTSTVTCTASVQYFAQSTGGATGNASATFPSDSWKAAITVGDSTGATSTAVSSAVDVGVLSAVNVGANASINYGTLGAGATTATGQEPTTTVQNAGNSSTTLNVWGTALTMGGGGAISLAADATTGETTGSTTQSVTISNQSSTDLNIVSVGFCANANCETTPSATVSVYDSNGNTYTLATITNMAAGQISIYYSANIASGNDTITASTSYGTSVYYLTVMASEWKGLATSNPLDQLGTSGGTSASPSVTSNGAIASAPELIYAVIDGPSIPTIVPPFTAITTYEAYLVSSTLSTYTANWTETAAWYMAAMATFKAAGVVNSIPASSEHYATSSFTFGGSEPVLSGSSTAVTGFLLTAPTSTSAVSSPIYWGINVPSSTPTGTYSGVNTFVATYSQ